MVGSDDTQGVRADDRSREETLALLDFEIEGLRRRIRESGWTSWGLMAAFGGVAWTLLDLVTRASFSFSHFAQSLVTCFCAREVLTTAVRLFDSAPHPTATVPRFHWSSTILDGQQLGAALQTCEVVIVAVFAVKFRGPVAPVGLIAIVTLVVVLILGNFGLLVTVYTGSKVPMPNGGKSPRWVDVTRLLPPAAALAAAIAYGGVVGLSDPPAVKAAALVLALFVLAEQMAQERAGHPLLGPLVELRRDVALSRVQMPDAVHRMEILLEGEELEHLLQDDVAKVSQSIDAHAKLSSRLRDAAEALMQVDRDALAPEQVRTSLESLMELDRERERLEASLNTEVIEVTKKHQQVSFVLKLFGIAPMGSRVLELLSAQLAMLERTQDIRAAVAKARRVAEGWLAAR